MNTEQDYPATIKTLTEKECIALQRRKKDGYGTKWPYKGHYNTGYLHENPALPALPRGWHWLHIPTWGMHVRREDDLDYMNDLN